MTERLVSYVPGDTLYSQGEPADAVLYVEQGRVQLSVLSPTGSEGVVGIVNAGEYLGEGALAGQRTRSSTATAMTACRIRFIPKDQMIRLLHQQHAASDHFIAHMLARSRRLEEDLVDQLFNPCERRLARALLLLARSTPMEGSRHVLPAVPHQVLAEMVGTTRSRVTVFMNQFRKRGVIDYDHHRLAIDAARLIAMLHEPIETAESDLLSRRA